MTTYTLCKSMINRGTYTSKEDMQIKLDVFFANNRIDQSEYEELTDTLVNK
ncbi:hypothetical protein [Lysinibacillus telephonicus]|uniref:hypothetical protein n=1 Tax=Lysinibacillus telephonicus TaxID=1714840 RepID=UPI0037D3B4DC